MATVNSFGIGAVRYAAQYFDPARGGRFVRLFIGTRADVADQICAMGCQPIGIARTYQRATPESMTPRALVPERDATHLWHVRD